jgi:hypothetical protein
MFGSSSQLYDRAAELSDALPQRAWRLVPVPCRSRRNEVAATTAPTLNRRTLYSSSARLRALFSSHPKVSLFSERPRLARSRSRGDFVAPQTHVHRFSKASENGRAARTPRPPTPVLDA